MRGKHEVTQKELSSVLGISKTLYARCNKEMKSEEISEGATEEDEPARDNLRGLHQGIKPAVDRLKQAMSRRKRKDTVPPETVKAIKDYWHNRSFPTANVRDQIAVR
jgi:hypothetical protein